MKISSRPRPPAVAPLAVLTAVLAAALALTSCTAPTGPSGSGEGTTPAPGPSTGGTGGAGGADEPAPSALELALDGPAEDVEEAAADAVAGMDTAEKAGQVLVGQLGAAGTDPASIAELNLGGIIVMGDAVPVAADGVHDVEALQSRLAETQEALSANRDWSGIISVDQEGGLVARIKEPLVEWPTPMSYGAAAAGMAGAEGADAKGESAAEGDAAQLAADGHALMGAQLAELGFTLDFAPSVDVTIGAGDPAIGARSFSSDPETVAALGTAATAGLLDAGVLPAPKHFPGHGSVTDDSHVTAPVQDASVADLESRDWLPFRELLAGEEQYTPVVMMGHVIVPELEPEVPSSVSAPAYEALRGLAGPDAEPYDGVVVTDALNMGALVERYGANEAPVRALEAGADLLLMPSDLPGARDALVEAVDTGEVPAERLDEAAERVVTMLLWRDRLAQELEEATVEEKEQAGVATGSGDGTGMGTGAENGPEAEPEQVSRDLSAAAITVVDGVCGAPLVEDSLQIIGGNEIDRARLAEAAEAAGLTVGAGPVVSLVGSARGSAQGDVVVALDAPFGLAQSPVSDGGAMVALYGRTPGAFEALVAVMTGEAEAPGALPVEVGEWPAGTGC
ncbi:glycoside hydrolase family 3 N-terminal domain-containing protein [Citricoccus sp.]|uniref:glycoside hydrolase family 3 N-terminal domain-containing protein n=1 Tax=Citricoccus sp. TaxID=1978372 RepID=UPI0028BEF3D9|nr:glycoside hydrolase family 3 N-terminal domain-containing protein [Citricoccus sp.]